MAFIIFILGMVLGSFYSCIGYRIPNKISIVFPNSRCDHCKKELKWYMNIPVFSFIFYKGKCSYCGEKIDYLCLVNELLVPLLFVIFYIKYGFSMNFFLSLIITSAFAVTLVSDLRYYYISDRVLVISYILELIIIYIFKKDMMLYHLIGSLSMFLFFIFTKLMGDRMFKRESLGIGDIKLIALVGLTLGFFKSMLSIFISCVLTLLLSLILKDKREIPFGPSLLLGTLIILLLVPDYILLN